MGSEMCIRDSPDRAAGPAGQPDRSAPAAKLSGRNRAFRAGDPVSCLLYTSDAADDLLCVDLGGRRILKKKTKARRTMHYE